MRRIVLASTSSYRKALLTRLQLPFETRAPIDVDESALDLPPRELVVALAEEKAQSLVSSEPNAIIIGSDQVATLDEEILTKPGTTDRAEAQLRKLAGRTHELCTGVCVLDSATGQAAVHLDVHRITLRALTDNEIADYVRREYPIDCAGSYKVEGLGVTLMKSIEGEDATAIVGLPLIAVTRALAEFGVPVLGASP